MIMTLRVNRTLAIDIRSDFATRMRSIGRTPQEIEKLDIFLSLCLQNVNDKQEMIINYINANG
jgi:hypothetical protein